MRASPNGPQRSAGRQAPMCGRRHRAAARLLAGLLVLSSGAVEAQSLTRPLEVVCAAGTAPVVRTTRVQLAFEPVGRDTASSRTLLSRVAARWTPPSDYELPPLAVWSPQEANYAFPPLYQLVEVVWDGNGTLLEVRQPPFAGHRQTRRALNAALDQAIRSAFSAAPGAASRAGATGARDSASVLFTARAIPLPAGLVVGALAVAHLEPGEGVRLLRFPTPEYPRALLAEGLEGAVDLSYVVRPDSSAAEILVVASPHPAFSEVALQSARRSRSVPGTAGGCVVSTMVRQRVAFRLAD